MLATNFIRSLESVTGGGKLLALRRTYNQLSAGKITPEEGGNEDKDNKDKGEERIEENRGEHARFLEEKIEHWEKVENIDNTVKEMTVMLIRVNDDVSEIKKTVDRFSDLRSNVKTQLKVLQQLENRPTLQDVDRENLPNEVVKNLTTKEKYTGSRGNQLKKHLVLIYAGDRTLHQHLFTTAINKLFEYGERLNKTTNNARIKRVNARIQKVIDGIKRVIDRLMVLVLKCIALGATIENQDDVPKMFQFFQNTNSGKQQDGRTLLKAVFISLLSEKKTT